MYRLKSFRVLVHTYLHGTIVSEKYRYMDLLFRWNLFPKADNARNKIETRTLCFPWLMQKFGMTILISRCIGPTSRHRRHELGPSNHVQGHPDPQRPRHPHIQRLKRKIDIRGRSASTTYPFKHQHPQTSYFRWRRGDTDPSKVDLYMPRRVGMEPAFDPFFGARISFQPSSVYFRCTVLYVPLWVVLPQQKSSINKVSKQGLCWKKLGRLCVFLPIYWGIKYIHR